MRVLQIAQPQVAQVLEVPDPQPGPDEVLIRVMASGICGTDIHILRGEYLGAYPVIPGHEFAGVVEAVGAEVSRFQVGTAVAAEPNIACDNCDACLNNRQNFCHNWQAVGVTRPGGMAELVVVPEKAVFAIGALPFEHGAFVEPLSCVLHGIERARIRAGDRVAVLGAGPIGVLLLQVARLHDAGELTVVERQPARRAFAALWAEHTLDSLEALEPDAYDVVIDATGVIAVMERTLAAARHGGTVLLFGVPPAEARLSVAAFTVFRKGLTVLSSFTSVRNSLQAIALLQAGRVDVTQLVSHRLPLAGFLEGVRLIETGAEAVRKVLLCPAVIERN